MKLAITVLYVLLAVLGGSLGYIAFDARSTAGEAKRIITTSPCKLDPEGEECQRILTESIRAFDEHTSCVLARKVGNTCADSAGDRNRPEIGGGEDASQATGRDSGQGSAVNAPAASGPGALPQPGGGDPGDGGGGPAPQPGPDAPAEPPPPPPSPGGQGPLPQPEPAQGVAGTGVNPSLPILGEACELAPVLCP